MIGPNNPRWNGGTSEYPDHYLFKKNRVIVLRKSGGLCSACGARADCVHHIDGDKKNHNIKNLSALCDQCHWKEHGRNPEIISLLKELIQYQKTNKITPAEIAYRVGVSEMTARNWISGRTYRIHNLPLVRLRSFLAEKRISNTPDPFRPVVDRAMREYGRDMKRKKTEIDAAIDGGNGK